MKNYYQFDIEVIPLIIGREALIAELAEIGFESFQNSDKGFTAFIPKEDYDKILFDEVSKKYKKAFQIEISQREIPYENWNQKWEADYQPILIDQKCMIRAPFHTKSDVEMEVIIQPQMSFGTGHHPTTSLMVGQMMKTKFQGKRVLDFGCGTGVLAILAIKLQAIMVDALDVDPICVANTQENAALNNTVNINVNNGSWDRISNEGYDFILANINKNVILNALPYLIKSMCEGGKLMCSGFFDSDVKDISKQAQILGFELIHQETLKSWALLEFWNTKKDTIG